VAPRGWENVEGERTSEGVGGQITGASRRLEAHGDVSGKLCRGAKACERIPRNVHSLRGGRRRRNLRAGPVRALQRCGTMGKRQRGFTLIQQARQRRRQIYSERQTNPMRGGIGSATG